MSRTRVTLAAVVLTTGALAVPAAFAEPRQCDKPVAVVVHEAHEAAEAVPGAGPVADELHDLEGQYCASPLPV